MSVATASLRKPGGSRRRSTHPGIPNAGRSSSVTSGSSKGSKEKVGGSFTGPKSNKPESKAGDPTKTTMRRRLSKESTSAAALTTLQVDMSCVHNDSIPRAWEQETDQGFSGQSSDVTDRSWSRESGAPPNENTAQKTSKTSAGYESSQTPAPADQSSQTLAPAEQSSQTSAPADQPSKEPGAAVKPKRASLSTSAAQKIEIASLEKTPGEQEPQTPGTPHPFRVIV